LITDIIGEKNKTRLKPLIIDKSEYAQYTESLHKELRLFEEKPYQLGALDVEIDVLVAVLSQLEKPDVLEIGIANGYSSAFLYYALNKIGGCITSIDLPKFSSSLYRPMERFDTYIRSLLVAKGKIVNSGTLGDLNPGGIIPEGKYAGWLVPMELRQRVRNITIYGNAFVILNELKESAFDFVVVDAMKSYDDRIRIMEMVDNILRIGGFCFLDGYWVNSAFVDFCERHQYPSWFLGRVGVFRKL